MTVDLTPDAPGSLRHPAEQARRRAMLRQPHMAALADYVQGLRARPGTEVPDLDPLDGGTGAGILFLLEKPGPGTSPTRPNRPGTGFVSRDNGDPTATAAHRFLQEAGLDRREMAIWNLIPWWNHTIRFGAAEQAAGAAELDHFLALLPRLHTVVLVGRTAARAGPRLGRYRVLVSDHPSPQVRAAFPERWRRIPAIWREAATPAAAGTP